MARPAIPPHPLIDRLRREHGEMHGVLALMRRQLDRIEACESPDLAVLTDALRYMRMFPGKVHHPLEELLFERLQALDPSLRSDIARLREQHKEIYQLERWLLEAAVAASRQGPAAYPFLLEFGQRYLFTQQQHSECEEKLIFPRALERLRAEDWRYLIGAALNPADPLFGKQATDRFRSIRAKMAQADAGA